ncbi:nucleotidyltransferase family protein [Pseudoflavonifractor sp. AF19-9AC]|uniref:nucleotidyltransferase family protein n=1 Tax=Pseudoflavonifractor sp. AF19-9AC TaxID=2292244 RepID=UPI000E536040|nr:nucleotidyltransferase family protein [Pseudoflavonifractor sp. AF19-9AC]RHR10334.1 nucleotidyltransferase family protein [Pseudoflavonifractor sp. AF19-9AC]
MKLGCVVLAAGRGVRFGGNKLIYPLAGRPVLSRVLGSLPREQLSSLVVVASSPEVVQLCREADTPCLCYEGGPQSDSIRLGIGAMARTDGCMFVMGDQPLCSRRSMERLLETFRSQPEAVVRLSFQGRPCSPVLFPSRYYPNLASLTGEQGGIAAVRHLNPTFRFVEAEEEAELWDTDTPEELNHIEHYLFKKEGRAP